MTHKRAPAAVEAPKGTVTDPLAEVVDKMNTNPPGAAAPGVPAAAPAPAPEPAALPPAHGKGPKGHPQHGGKGAPVAVAAAATPAPAAAAGDGNPAAARYRDTSTPALKISAGAPANRPPPSQAEITSVINNNRGGIKNCYQRALLRDNSMTHGKITVKLTLGISGRVKHTVIDGPQQFRALEPCIKELVARWVFPQASDEYGTEFVYVFQGNE